jgi:GNAT superfamily N-acetyltransferase
MSANGLAARARDFQHAKQAAVCDRVEPWSHGTVVRASRYPGYYEYNLLRLERGPLPALAQLKAAADEALADAEHRRIDFELAADAQALRPALREAGWKTSRLVWMRHEGPRPTRSGLDVEEADYDEAEPLRVQWHEEDFPGVDPSAYHAAAREVSLLRGVRTLIVREGSVPVGFAQLEGDRAGAEVASVYVSARHRGRGRGTAITRAAIAAAAGIEDLWIVADDEDRPKQLYARLGFVPAWTAIEATLWP